MKNSSTVSTQVSTILNALEEGLPGFVLTAVLDALTQAANRAGLEAPTYSPESLMDGAKLKAVLEHSQGLDLHGAAADKLRVIEATTEILRNPHTPSDLWEGVAEFVTTSLNRGGDSLHYGPPMLALVLDSYPPDELRGAVIAAREEGQANTDE